MRRLLRSFTVDEEQGEVVEVKELYMRTVLEERNGFRCRAEALGKSKCEKMGYWVVIFAQDSSSDDQETSYLYV